MNPIMEDNTDQISRPEIIKAMKKGFPYFLVAGLIAVPFGSGSAVGDKGWNNHFRYQYICQSLYSILSSGDSFPPK